MARLLQLVGRKEKELLTHLQTAGKGHVDQWPGQLLHPCVLSCNGSACLQQQPTGPLTTSTYMCTTQGMLFLPVLVS